MLGKTIILMLMVIFISCIPKLINYNEFTILTDGTNDNAYLDWPRMSVFLDDRSQNIIKIEDPKITCKYFEVLKKDPLGNYNQLFIHIPEIGSDRNPILIKDYFSSSTKDRYKIDSIFETRNRETVRCKRILAVSAVNIMPMLFQRERAVRL